MDEAAAFEEFIRHHVAPDPERDVQRMLLWTEWVRYYLRKNRHFPESVLEKKFDELILRQFDVAVAFDSFRGPVYVGIKYTA